MSAESEHAKEARDLRAEMERLTERAERAEAEVATLKTEVEMWRRGAPPLPWRGIYANREQTKYMVEQADAARAERDALRARVAELEAALRDVAERQREACADEVFHRSCSCSGVVRDTPLVEVKP
jgi:uncharacterized coiled-coil DUF342 family protein